MRMFELISGQVTAAVGSGGNSITFYPVTMIDTDSLTIRPFDDALGHCEIFHVFGTLRTSSQVGIINIKKQKNDLDVVNGNYFPFHLISDRSGQYANARIPVEQMETLTVKLMNKNFPQNEITIFQAIIHYTDLTGFSSTFITANELERRRVRKVNVLWDTINSVNGGTYENQTAINTLVKGLLPKKKYAILGVHHQINSSTYLTSVSFRSPEWGNIRVGQPIGIESGINDSWFYHQSRISGLPMIPVFTGEIAERCILETMSTGSNSNNATFTVHLVELA